MGIITTAGTITVRETVTVIRGMTITAATVNTAAMKGTRDMTTAAKSRSAFFPVNGLPCDTGDNACIAVGSCYNGERRCRRFSIFAVISHRSKKAGDER